MSITRRYLSGIGYNYENDQYLYRTWMHSPVQGKFLLQDPTDMTAGSNMYAYVRKNPTNKKDPTGLVAPDADIDGGGGGTQYDLSQCPCTSTWSSVTSCVNDIYWEFPEECVEICWENCQGSDPEDLDISAEEVIDNWLTCTGICSLVGCTSLCAWLVATVVGALACQSLCSLGCAALCSAVT